MSRARPVGRRGPTSRFLRLAIAIGLASGLLEVLLLATEKLALGRMIFYSRQALWMTPVAEAGIALVAACLLLALGRVRPAVRSDAAGIFTFVFLGTLSVLLLYPPLHMAARAVLAAGIGVQASRIASRRPRLATRLAASAPWLAGVVAAAAVSLNTGMALAERAAVRRLPTPRADAPSLLFIILDTVRARSLSLYGAAEATTPDLERLARRGTTFDMAIAPAPWTLPSHASMFTGRHARELSADWRTPLDDAEPTLAEILAARGYRTAGFVANTGYAGWESGLQRGFAHFEDYPITIGQVASSSPLGRWLTRNGVLRRLVRTDENVARKGARQVGEEFLDWLPREDGRPFFAFLNYFDAHGPYMPPEPFRSEFAGPDGPRGGMSPLHRWNGHPDGPPPPPDVIEKERRAYAGAIAYLDSELGRLFERLDEEGHLDHTLVVIASDHGEEFGEHGVFDHGNSLYLPGLRVPLLLVFPGRVPEGARVRTPVSLTDLPATILSLLDPSDTPRLPGRVLLPAAPGGLAASDGGAPPAGTNGAVLSEVSYAPRLPAWFPVSGGDMVSLVSGRFHYIRDGRGREELYDLGSDIEETHDISMTPAADTVLAGLRRAIEGLPPKSGRGGTGGIGP
ncbi:MAG: sulfatase-like hydrolase/transferase [Gemmatimonadota bacterium]